MRVKTFFRWGVVGSLVIIVFTLIFKLNLIDSLVEFPSGSTIHLFLQKKTKFQASFPNRHELQKNRHLIYVMGGSEKNLQERFKKASELLHAGIGDKILVFIQPGITAFNQALGRNLTNEEWASEQLEYLKIQKGKYVFTDFEEGFFGTLTECKNLLVYVKQHGYIHVHIVTSTYHSQRTWLTFYTLSHDYHPISFSVHDAGDIENTRDLLKEYGKLLFYEIIFLLMY